MEKGLDVEQGTQEYETKSVVSLASYDSRNDAALVRKQDRRIVPLSAGIYLLCYLDRANIGNAKVLNSETHNDLLSETHMTDYDYTIALMVFLVAYAIFEVPSNYLLKRLRPSRWIAFLMFAWGAITMGISGTKSYAAVTVARFLLGAVEAGLFPGLVYYLTFWYRTEERSMRVAIILASATLAGAFGGAIAYGVGHMNGASGLSAWRWLFILGLSYKVSRLCFPPSSSGSFLPDYPETAIWLSPDEKTLAASRLRDQASLGSSKPMTWVDAKATLTDWRLCGHYAIYFGISTPFASLSFFAPSIIAGLGYTSLNANLMTVPPYAVAYVFTILVAWSADRNNSRGLHSAIFALIGAAGFMASALLPATAYLHRYACLIVATTGSFACIPPLLGWLSSNIDTTAAAGLAIALNISVGAPGQIVGVWIYKADQAARGYPTGHWTNAGLLLFVAVGCVVMVGYYRAANGRVGGGEARYRSRDGVIDQVAHKSNTNRETNTSGHLLLEESVLGLAGSRIDGFDRWGRLAKRPPLSTVSAELSSFEVARTHPLSRSSSTMYHIAPPILRIPPEILSLIVEEYVADDNDSTKWTWMLPACVGEEEPEHVLKARIVALTQVCRHWRSFVTDMPTAWTVLYLSVWLWPRAECGTPIATLLAGVERSLTLSKGRPLHIYLRAPDWDDLACSVLKLIAAHSSRWHTVNFEIPPKSLAFLASEIKDGTGLQTLRNYTIAGVSSAIGKATKTLFAGSPPALREITMGWGLQYLSLPWDKLESVNVPAQSFRWIKPPLFGRLSVKCELTISVCVLGLRGYYDGPPVASRIGSLIVELLPTAGRAGSQSDCSPIFGSFTFPALSRLTYTGPKYADDSPGWPHAAYMACAERSGFGERLTSLDVKAYITEAELVEVLAGLPQLLSLALCDIRKNYNGGPLALISDSLLRHLERRLPGLGDHGGDNDLAVFAPRLVYASLRSGLACSDRAILDFVASRAALDPASHDETPSFELNFLHMVGAEEPEELVEDGIVWRKSTGKDWATKMEALLAQNKNFSYTVSRVDWVFV
ncbi:MFS domain-containing protein [Mycena chlorophos]|uniref:MFS domain-containing protein n=1 Tax=Mycena chlorophos TaxID=658473 RepID=A0A8H6SV28_MYCCL|nr:MFS domain-containing protein [Mycena chlorophos]